MTPGTEDWRRDQAAKDEGHRYGPQPAPATDSQEQLRHGTCVITDASDLDGTYTVTEQWWDPAAEAWESAMEPYGHVTVDARDVFNRIVGQVDDRVPFWEERDQTGAIRIIINVPPLGEGTCELTVDLTGGLYTAKEKQWDTGAATFIDKPSGWTGTAVHAGLAGGLAIGSECHYWEELDDDGALCRIFVTN